MRVLYVVDRPSIHHDRFVDAMRSHGADVDVVDIADAPLARGTERVREEVQERHPDVILAGPVPTAGLAAVRAGGAPVVALSWGFDLLQDAGDPSVAAAAREALEGSSMLVVDADAVADAAREHGYGGPIRCLRWGTDLERFNPPPAGAPRSAAVVSIRPWEPTYRIDTVIDAFAIARRSISDLRLVLAGGGSVADALARQANELRVTDAVDWIGRVPEASLAPLLAGGGVYVSASVVDGTSVSLLQAMASGLPIVVSDIAGNRPWILDRPGSRTAPVGEATAFASAIVEAIGLDDVERASVGSAHRALVERRADWRVGAERLMEILRAAAA